MSSSKCILLAIALLALPAASASAQQSPEVSYARIAREGYNLSKADAERLEATLGGNPDDLGVRAKL